MSGRSKSLSGFEVETSEGRFVELLRDGVQIVGANGQTLPLASTIYDDFEAGITARSLGLGTASLLVDELRIATEPRFPTSLDGSAR